MKSKSEFFGKNIIITGASSGIGQAAGFYFLNSGANVLLAGRDKNSLSIFQKFKNARIAVFDIKKDMSLYDFKTTIVELLGKIDILINCAGVKLDSDIEKTYPQDFDYTINVNLRSVFLLYAMSKAGLETLTRYAAADFASLGIRINAITACPIESNSLLYAKGNETDMQNIKDKMEKNVPLGRIARPDDIVKVIVFLASKRSEKITGQIIKVDGGRSLTSSGYVHYKGIFNMNSRFEPDGVNLKTWLDDKFSTKVLRKKKW